MTKAQSDLEEALEKASAKLSRQGKAGAEGWKAQLTKMLDQLKWSKVQRKRPRT